MTAISEAGCARCAPCGVVRVLSRVVVLGGLVLTGWLLASGLALAADDGPGGQLGAPPTVASALASAVSAVPSRSVPPPARLGFLTPPRKLIANAVDVAKPVTRVLESPGLASHSLAQRTLALLSRTAQRGAGTGSSAPAEAPAAAPRAEPATRAAVATAPGLALWPSAAPVTGSTAVNHSRRCATSLFARPLVVDDHPAPSVPVRPAGSTASVSMTGGNGSGAGTNSVAHAAMSDSWASTRLRQLCRPRYLNASDLPCSPAGQPSTSPD
ncbi:MAG: hypothetical protein ACRDRS_24665 [Pseudonocardiaceae bacterium]